jgi:hypothetical protein
MSDGERRNKAITFAVSPGEVAQIEAAAASEGLAMASYVRRLVVTHLARQNAQVSPVTSAMGHS